MPLGCHWDVLGAMGVSLRAIGVPWDVMNGIGGVMGMLWGDFWLAWGYLRGVTKVSCVDPCHCCAVNGLIWP